MRTEDPVGGMADATVSLTGRGEFTPGGVDSVSRNGSGLVRSILCMLEGARCDVYMYSTHCIQTGHSGEGWI